MSSSDDDGNVSVTVSKMGTGDAMSKARETTQLDERHIATGRGWGIRPPYPPETLAAFSELNETHAAAIRKKARWEAGYGFDIVPHSSVDPEEASDDQRDTVDEFWYGSNSKWQTGPEHTPATTPTEVLELARMDYHMIGWCALEILVSPDHRIYRDDVQIGTVGPSTTSYTDTGLDNGTTYDYYVEAVFSNAENTTTATVSGTTTLPDVTGFSLDGSVQGELLAENFGAGLNAGQYRIRWEENDVSSYDSADEATVAFDADPLEYNITGVLDGEKYDVGIRSETTDVTGAWHTANEITALIAASGLSSTPAQKQIDLSWTVESDFDGSQQVWRDRADYEFPDPKGEQIATLSSTASSYTDAGLYPDRDYTYTIRAQTQYVHADTSSTTTTDSAGLAQSPAPPRGWHIEIDHPSDQTITPQVLDGVQFEPRVNDLPRVRVPVPRDEAFTLEAYEGADMRVWKDGERQPIDELEDVSIDPGQCELVGVGGTQLERRVGVNVIQEATHTIADDLISTETDYATVVDEPVVEEVTDELLAGGSTEADLSSAFSPRSADPFVVANGGLEAAQTLYPHDAGDGSQVEAVPTTTGSPRDDSELTGGRGRLFDESADYIEFYPFTLDHDILEDDVGVAVRWKGGSDPSDIRVSIHDDSDGTEIGAVDFNTGGQAFGPVWDYEDTNFGTTWSSGDLAAGNYYIRVEGLQNSTDGSLVDLVCLFDRRYHNESWDNSLHESGGHLDGSPGGFWLHPAGEPIETGDTETIYSITTGYGNTVWNDTSNNQALALSNDSGRTWTEATNSTSVMATFSDLGASLRLRVTIGAYAPDGARAASPRYGYAPQRLESYELRFDGDDTPLVINDSRDADLVDILAAYAERSDSLFEVRQDGDQTVVHWAQAGQRSSGQDLPLADYSVTKRGSRTLRCTVKGGGTSTRETVDAVLDDAVALEETSIIPGTETVRDAETGERYEYLRDYTVDNATGTIEALSTGGIADGQTLEVEYDYKVSGTYEHDDYAGDPRYDRTETINGITTERGCELAAKLIVDTTAAPRWEADVTIPAGEHVDGLLEALDVDGIASESMSVYQLDVSPQLLSLRLGSRRRVEDALQQIRSTVEATSDRV